MTGLNVDGHSSYITETWKDEIKEVLDTALILRNEVMWLDSDFGKGTGDILHIPTMSQMTARDYTEGNQITLEDPTSNEFQLTINKYKQVGIQITEKFKDDSMYVSNLLNKYRRETVRTLMRALDSDIANLEDSQTNNDPNTIGNADHRFVSVATDNLGGVEDFQLAHLGLQDSDAYDGNANAIISPFFHFRLQQIGNLLGQDVYGANRILKDTGEVGKVQTAANAARTLVGSIAGFNTHVSNVLDYAVGETITAASSGFSTGTVSSADANMFLGTDPFVGAMRTTPRIKEWTDNNTLSDVIHATFRYGLKLYRPESLMVCLTDRS